MINKREFYLNKYYTTKEGYNIKIVKYENISNIDVQFDNGYIVINIAFDRIKKGNIKNPFHKTVFNVGYYGGKYNNKNRKIYNIWYKMLQRCYNKDTQERQPTYIDCSVDEHWHNFQNFIQWVEENYVESWQLDKDILLKGNKIYSPDTCCFVPREINTLFTKRKAKRGLYPIGITKHGNSYQSELCIKGVSKIIGSFKTPEEAFNAYKIAKEQHIKNIADSYKNQISEEVYQAMYNYQVEITD